MLLQPVRPRRKNNGRLMSFLELNGLTKTYADGTAAVKGIDWGCEEGEFVVLLGPSGCGKTTTLRMIAGLETPTGGRIKVDGADVGGLPPAARDVGFVFQFYALYPHLTVRDNIAFPLESMKVAPRERRERVAGLLARLKIEALAGLYPRQLSGGDQQRVALARAMVRRPRLYLMDEPLGTLDADLRLEMREWIRARQLETGVTTIYVTHDQEEAMTLADQVVVMDAGRIRQSGPPAAVYERPADLFVAHFVGSPAMNFIEGEVEGKGDGRRFTASAGGWQVPLPRPLRRGRTVLGVRPEFVGPASPGLFSARVVTEEYMGFCRTVYLDAGFGRLAMQVGGGRVHRRGEVVTLGFDLRHLRYFDADSGDSL